MLRPAIFALALGLLTGCFSTYTPIQYYDLNPAKTDSKITDVNLLPVRNLSGAGSKLMFKSGNRVEFDEYNSFIQNPDVMLQRNFRELLDNSGGIDGKFKLSINLLRFEFDRDQKQAVLALDVTVKTDGKTPVSRTLSFTSPFAVANGIDPVMAMQKNLDEASRAVAALLTECAK